MAFWSALFAPKCEECGGKIVDAEPVAYGGKKICPACHATAKAAEAAKQAEVEARRVAEEEARARFEQGKLFGTDPRSRK